MTLRDKFSWLLIIVGSGGYQVTSRTCIWIFQRAQFAFGVFLKTVRSLLYLGEFA